MLHITNGDSTATTLRAGVVAGIVQPWRDALHEGPVPAGLPLAALSAVRARFIAEQGWGDHDAILAEFQARDATLAGYAAHDEMTLWFEHDLYDQLQLAQVLDWCAEWEWDATRLSLICIGAFPGKPRFLGLGELSVGELATLWPTRHPASGAEMALARAAWRAFRAPDPSAIAALIAGDTTALPYLGAALTRHLEEFPATDTGLARSERTLLAVIVAGNETPHAIFSAFQARESAPFLGDTSLWLRLRRLSAGLTHPLILGADGAPFATPEACASADAFTAQRLRLTSAGQAVLTGRADHLALNGIDRWLGGAHLRSGGPLWRWDAARGQLISV